MNICALFVHNANWQLGTPEELSCFTPSPIASSPSVPSPDFWHVRSPDLLPTFIVSPSQDLAPNAASPDLPQFRESPNDEVDLTYFKFMKILVDRLASWDSVKLEIIPTNPRESRYSIGVQTMGDVNRVGVCYPTGPPSDEDSLYLMLLGLNPSLPRLGSCFVRYVGKRMMSSRIMWQSTLVYFVLFTGFMSDRLARLKTASTQLGLQKFSDSLRIRTSSDVRGSPSEFELSVTGLGYNIVVTFSSLTSLGLEQKHSPDGRRRESFDSVMSLDSFLSDPVVNWNELLYGYNQ